MNINVPARALNLHVSEKAFSTYQSLVNIFISMIRQIVYEVKCKYYNCTSELSSYAETAPVLSE